MVPIRQGQNTKVMLKEEMWLFLHSRSTATLSLVPYRLKAFVVLPIVEQRMLLYQAFHQDSLVSSWHADVPSAMKSTTTGNAELG